MRKILEKDFQTVQKFPQVKHISSYELTYEKNTPLYKLINNKLSEEKIINLYKKRNFILKNQGFKQYEISNFSKPRFESKHNSAYWQNKNYIGLGSGAHSFVNNIRWANIDNIQKYLLNREISYKENLTIEESAYEFIFLGLRQNIGFNINEYNQKFQKNFMEIYAKELKILQDESLIKIINNQISLTAKGMLLSESVFFNVFNLFSYQNFQLHLSS